MYCGEHPIHFAGKLSTQPLAEFYMSECHLPVDLVSPFLRQTLLHTAASSGKGTTSMVKWSVEEKGASVTLKDREGKTAADLALHAGNLKIHQYLRTRGMIEAKARRDKKQQKEEKQHKFDLATRERQAAQAAEAFLAELEAEAKEEEEKKNHNKKKKSKGGKANVDTVIATMADGLTLEGED